jgi:hypothetical protein
MNRQSCKPLLESNASFGALPPAGWAGSEKGEIENGEPRHKDEEEEDDVDDDFACFKHCSQRWSSAITVLYIQYNYIMMA